MVAFFIPLAENTEQVSGINIVNPKYMSVGDYKTTLAFPNRG